MGTQELKKLFDGSVARLQDLVPVGIDPKAIVQAFNLTVTNPKFAAVNPIVLIQKFELAAQLGLKVNGPEGHCYMIPIKDRDQQSVEMFIGYKGYIEMACRSGHIQSVRSYAVYENDFFEADFGTDPKLIHRPNVSNPGAIKCYYTVAYHRDGWRDFLIMSPERVNRVRNKSKGYIYAKKESKDHPWISSYDEMAMKTTASRLLRTIRLPMGDLAFEEDEPDFDPVPVDSETVSSQAPDPPANQHPNKSAILGARDRMKKQNSQPPIDIPATVVDPATDPVPAPDISTVPVPATDPAPVDPVSVLPPDPVPATDPVPAATLDPEEIMGHVERFWNDAQAMTGDESKAMVSGLSADQRALRKSWYELIIKSDPDTDPTIGARVATLLAKAGIDFKA